MFSESLDAVMYTCREMMRDTYIGVRKPLLGFLQSCFPGYIDPVRFLDMPIVCHKDDSSFVLGLERLLIRADEIEMLIGFENCWPSRAYDQYFIVRDTYFWYPELHFELRHRRSRWPWHIVSWHSTEVIALSRRDHHLSFVDFSDVCSAYDFLSSRKVTAPCYLVQ